MFGVVVVPATFQGMILKDALRHHTTSMTTRGFDATDRDKRDIRDPSKLGKENPQVILRDVQEHSL